MKVALISSSIFPIPTWRFTGYGSEIITYYLARWLRGQGHEVFVIAPYSSSLPPDIPLAPIRASYLSTCLACEYEAVKFFSHVLAKADVVHDMSALALVAEFSYKFGRPTLVTRNGFDLNYPRSHKRNIVVLSKAVQRYAQYLGIKTRVVPYGIPINEYPFCGRDDRKDYVLYVGRPHPSKGVDLIIEVAKKMPNTRFILAWNPTFYDHMEYHMEYSLKARGLRNVVIINLPSGWRGEQVKRQLLCRARLFMQPTVYLEAFGLTAIEAMATGTPVLLSTAGSGPEIVKAKTVGLLVRNKLSLKEQAEEWRSHILDAIDIEELRQAVEEGLERRWRHEDIRAYAEERFDVSMMGKRYVELYEGLIRGESWGD